MSFSITESQKKLIMLLFTIMFSALIITLGVQSVYDKIKLNKEELETLKTQEDGLRSIIEDVTIEPNYEKIKKDSKMTFEQNYKSFKANEKIEEIVTSLGLKLNSINISPYTEVEAVTYESSIVQPKNTKDYTKMQADMAGELINLFLVSQISISLDVNDSQCLQLINAINNIPPEGLGEKNKERYCLQIPSVEFVPQGETVREVSLQVNMYGMTPPPIEEEEQ